MVRKKEGKGSRGRAEKRMKEVEEEDERSGGGGY